MAHKLTNTEGTNIFVYEPINTLNVIVTEWLLCPTGWIRIDSMQAPIKTARGWYKQLLERGYVKA